MRLHFVYFEKRNSTIIPVILHTMSQRALQSQGVIAQILNFDIVLKYCQGAKPPIISLQTHNICMKVWYLKKLNMNTPKHQTVSCWSGCITRQWSSNVNYIT